MKKLHFSILILLTAMVSVTGLPALSALQPSASAAPGSGSNGLDDDVEDDIEDDVEDDIESDIEDDVEDDIESDIEDDVEDDIESDVEDDVEDDIESDIEDDVEDDIESDIEDDVEDDIESDIEDDVEDDIESDIEDDVEDDIESDIEDDVEDDIESDIEDDVEDDIESDIEDDVEDDIESDVEDDIEDDIEDDAEDDIEDDAETRIEDRIEAEFEAARDAADRERDLARALARAERDAALALPGADEDAIRAAFDAAIDAADDGRDASREQARAEFDAASASLEAAQEIEDEESDGSSNSGSGNNNDDFDNSGPGSSNSGSGSSDDDDDDNSGSGSSNSGSSNDNDDNNNASPSGTLFELDYDDRGNAIERDELLVLVQSAALDEITRRGIETTQIQSLNELDLVLARIETTGRTIDQIEAEIRSAAPSAQIDYNHVYRRHEDDRLELGTGTEGDPAEGYQPGTGETRGARFGEVPGKLFDLPVVDGGAGRSIGIIDTRVNISHASLANAQIRQQGFVPYSHDEPEAHGTSVASILAGDDANYLGLLPKADIYAASVFFNSATGSETATTESLVGALYWMADNDVAVVNMSLIGPPNDILENVIDRLYEKGTIVVAAVGNNGPSAPPLYPAAYDKVVAVTAVSSTDRVYRLANRGEHVDFAAPGVNVLHADDRGDFAASSGTSMAAPFVAAVLAASGGSDGRITAEHMDALEANAKDLGQEGFDPIYGNGLIRPLSD